MDINKVIDDFVNCSEMKYCYECEADTSINGSSCTCCALLSAYRQRLHDKLNEVIEKN